MSLRCCADDEIGANPEKEEQMSAQLTFGRGNAKLEKTIYTFSIPAGHSCPGDCAVFGESGSSIEEQK